MAGQRGTAYIGTSGWAYKSWRSNFYPADIPSRADKMMLHYAAHFNAVEVNGTFYRLPKTETVQGWHAAMPANFSMACKMSRYVTHMKKLNPAPEQVAAFMQLTAQLGDQRGPVLLQLPPSLGFNADKLRNTLHAMREHDPLSGVRIALECRNTSWYCKSLFDLLAESTNTALVCHDMPGSVRNIPDDSADFVYIRLHGPKGDYGGSYDDNFIQTQADKINRHLDAGRDVYIFFNNDKDGHAPNNALRLWQLVHTT